MKALTKGFNGGLWAFRLVFAVVVAELAIVAGTVVGCFEEDICTDADTQAIKETMQGLATKSFALYAAEKGISSNSKKEEEAQMALPKSTGPGALTRKQFGYTAPSHEQLMEELEYIVVEMGGTLTVNPNKITIEY